jgi:hypothetical protein
MPTGYTEILERDPNTSFRTFALRCTRAMGVCMMQRDEPLDVPPPDKLDPCSGYRESLDKAMAAARELEEMTVATATRRAKEQHERNVQANKEFLEEHAREMRVYGAMLEKVEAWEPPTPAHEGLKKFMREQLTISMPRGEPYQCDETLLTGEQWLDRARKKAAADVQWHAEKCRLAVKDAEEGTAWLEALRASLSNIEEKT